MIRQALERIGLTEGECEVYEALIELGLSSTGKITKQANIASSKVYEVLQRLQQKGLVSFVSKNGVRYYDATPPERLVDFLEEKKTGITEAQEEIKKVIPVLKLKRKTVQESHETIVYTGIQGPKIVLREILDAGKRGISHEGFGTDEDPYAEHLPNELKKFVAESRKYKFKQRLLFAKGFISPNTAAEIRYLPQEYLPPVRTMIYGDKVAIVDFTKPVTTIVIEKKEIADAYRKHFDLLWHQDTWTYSGFTGVQQVFDEMLQYGEIWFIGGNWGIKKYFPEYWKKHNAERIKRKVFWHDLIVRTYAKQQYYEEFGKRNPTELREQYFYEWRELPQEVASPAVIGIYGNMVAHIVWGKETRITVFRNKEIFEHYRKYFHLLWKIASA
ncbi:MAG TPA: helix-turn-helix domain-containing protein [Candidatus Nanoarchaeia archaeon]|nr:helix-turn-helix domain-containing protein [Candidatus Nanoarchaeia archaeon]